MKARFQSALESAGVDSSKIPDIMQQIDDAASKVRSSGGDRNAVKSAIDGVLNDNGVDVQAFRKALDAHHHKGPRQAAPSGANFAAQLQSQFEFALNAVGVDSGKVPDILSQITSALSQVRTQGGNHASVKSAIDDILTSNGVDVQKFNDALEAQRAQNAQQSGSLVDVAA
ncbi:MAG TPA: Clp protease N-terminal domain-containing protein [Phycisphaerales bacterium]|nr:Clp protease N-terminal domain-containing protein [Phycisphaerales bacterium]